MPIGSSLNVTLPTPGGSTGTWGTTLNTALNLIIAAVEGTVPVSAINFNADFNIGTNAITGIEYSQFVSQSSSPAGNSRIYLNVSGEWVMIDGAGNEVTVTSNGDLNLAAGGQITGAGYGTSGVELNWDTTNFNFKDGTGADDFSPVRVGTLGLNDGSGNFLTFDVPSMSTNYSLTLPSAVPSSNSTLLQSDTSGNVTFSNSLDQHITFTSSARIKHDGRTICFPAVLGAENHGATQAWTYGGGSNGGYVQDVDDAAGYDIPIMLEIGARVTQISVHVNKADTSNTEIRLYSTDTTDGTNTVEAGPGLSGASGYQQVIINPSYDVISNEMLYVNIISPHANDTVFCAYVTYTIP